MSLAVLSRAACASMSTTSTTTTTTTRDRGDRYIWPHGMGPITQLQYDDQMYTFVLRITGYVQLITSLLNIFYTTAQFPQQVRLQKPEETQIKTFSVATGALIIWRTLVVGSRILTFVMFASLFYSWLYVVICFHYSLMFSLVFYQMRLTENVGLISRVIYNVVTPFVYIFDFCVNWLAGPTRYWYVMVYVPMYCENLLMSALGLWRALTRPSPDYVIPGCICAVIMFPLGVLVQAAYYRYWHPNVALKAKTGTRDPSEPDAALSPRQSRKTTQLRKVTWSRFRNEVFIANHPQPL